MFDLLRRLCEVSAPSGCETHLHELISKEVRPFADDISTDALGNLIVHKKGAGKRLMLCAHVDEIGLIATCFSKEGGVYISALGGVLPQAALYQRVRFTGGAEGVVVPDGKPEELPQNLKLQNLYVDIGAKTQAEAEERVKIGEAAAFCGTFSMQGDCLISKALDDRAGCFVLIEALKCMKTHTNDLYFVFTAAEELGLRGAKAAAGSVRPDYAVAVDVTRTGDVPSAPKMAVELGKGVAIKIKDSSFLAHPMMKDTMKELCIRKEIPYQLEVLERGGTDAGAIHITGGGVPSGCISLPTRYIHTPGEMMHKADLNGAVALMTALLEEGIQ
ncbi:MAG: M42 family metallopeptidase [Ruminococcaceae bacterium]|nr:M42 family metallopeptidase [Oscillospiraceae bacterium]